MDIVTSPSNTSSFTYQYARIQYSESEYVYIYTRYGAQKFSGPKPNRKCMEQRRRHYVIR